MLGREERASVEFLNSAVTTAAAAVAVEAAADSANAKSLVGSIVAADEPALEPGCRPAPAPLPSAIACRSRTLWWCTPPPVSVVSMAGEAARVDVEVDEAVP